MKKIWVILLCILGYSPVVLAQQDSTVVLTTDSAVSQPVAAKKPAPQLIKRQADTGLLVHKHSPKKAMLLSALLPGAGQIYNQKYWKAPVVWTGFVVFGYFINQNNREYKRFRTAYNLNEDRDSTTISEFPNVSSNLLANERDIYRKWRDLSIILTVGWYALNIIDANVDAHLFEFDVSDVATLRWQPDFNFSLKQPKQPFSGGIKLTLGF